MVPEREWLRAGQVAAPHGLDGSFRVTGGSAKLLVPGRAVRIGESLREIERLAGHERRVILRVSGCHDRDGAGALRGQTLLVRRDQAPELDVDEWWAEDLEGCSVHDGPLRVGMVRRLLAMPSCELLEVARAGRADLLVPLISDAVRSVDIEARMIDVDLSFLGEEGQ